ncbi:MAG: hypothetical protein JWR69_3502 [Pedosphaera sp.]|nr:hypothetical protein [Pedosphaera sp.]
MILSTNAQPSTGEKDISTRIACIGSLAGSAVPAKHGIHELWVSP